jgi:hypothetical protein
MSIQYKVRRGRRYKYEVTWDTIKKKRVWKYLGMEASEGVGMSVGTNVKSSVGTKVCLHLSPSEKRKICDMLDWVMTRDPKHTRKGFSESAGVLLRQLEYEGNT